MKPLFAHLAIGMLACGVAAIADSKPLEIIALVDHYDFAAVPDPAHPGQYAYDTETSEGCAKILDHVLLTGAKTILWRPQAGSMLRYPTKEEGYLSRYGMDKRRILINDKQIYSWVRYQETELNLFDYCMGLIRERGLCCGVHWPFEQNHWSPFTFGPWNQEHPQFWCLTKEGAIWQGHTSLSFPEVMEHKLRIADELLATKPEVIYMETWREGGWSPRLEYVQPMVARWRERYGDAELPNPQDLRWCELVAEVNHEWYRRLRERMSRLNPPPRLMVGIAYFGPGGSRDDILRVRGIDWPKMVEEHLIDGLVVMGVNWDKQRPFESTKEIYQDIMNIVAGRCQVFFSIQGLSYDYRQDGPESYAKVTGLPQEKCAIRMMDIIKEVGAAGIVLEVVDHENFVPEVRETLKHVNDERP